MPHGIGKHFAHNLTSTRRQSFPNRRRGITCRYLPDTNTHTHTHTHMHNRYTDTHRAKNRTLPHLCEKSSLGPKQSQTNRRGLFLKKASCTHSLNYLFICFIIRYRRAGRAVPRTEVVVGEGVQLATCRRLKMKTHYASWPKIRNLFTHDLCDVVAFNLAVNREEEHLSLSVYLSLSISLSPALSLLCLLVAVQSNNNSVASACSVCVYSPPQSDSELHACPLNLK